MASQAGAAGQNSSIRSLDGHVATADLGRANPRLRSLSADEGFSLRSESAKGRLCSGLGSWQQRGEVSRLRSAATTDEAGRPRCGRFCGGVPT